jgi:hydroxypyruvate isomerase
MENNNNHTRRHFVKRMMGAGAAMALAPNVIAANTSKERKRKKNKLKSADQPFHLKYAPHFGMFKELAGNDPIEYIKFCHDMGFRAMFDNGLMNRPKIEQEKIANELNRLGMDLGPFVLYADFSVTSFVEDKEEVRSMLREKMAAGIEVAQRTGAKWALVVPGRYHEKLHGDYQTANVISNLRMCADQLETSGLTLVLEPLNTLRNHPGLFLTGIPQSYMICKAVNSPSCKIVNDIYHQQITEGNIIPNIDDAWSEIAAFHTGDNPGRKEPTSGEINYKNVFRHIFNKGYSGVLCMEHGQSIRGIEGEKRIIEAYRECDDFLDTND